MLTTRSPVAAVLLTLSLLGSSLATPTPQNRNGRQRQKTAQAQAAQVPQGISQATDGSTILDTTVTINGLDIRYRISGPADQFTTTSGVTGGTQAPGTQGTVGLNVLLHGDGGTSFFDYPNQGVQNGLAGVTVLAPDPNLFWGGGSGLQRTDGVAHAAAVNELIQTELPQMMAFNSSQVFFTGVSGGSLLLSGFFVPTHMTNYQGTGVLLNCAALEPQVDFVDAAAVMSSTRIHYQSTKQELTLLQPAIPAAIKAYEQVSTGVGMTPAQINALQTVDNTPNGGHCAFDEQGFVSGVQLMADSYANIMQPGGNGQVQGIGAVNNGVVGNENLVFTGSARQKRSGMVG